MHPALRALCAAERARMIGRCEPDLWLAAARALDAVPEAEAAAYAWFRAAESMLFNRDRTGAIEPLRAAWLASTRLGAQPLVTRIVDLARRARLIDALVVSVPDPADGGGPATSDVSRQRRLPPARDSGCRGASWRSSRWWPRAEPTARSARPCSSRPRQPAST